MYIALGIFAVLAAIGLISVLLFRVVVPTNEVHIVQTTRSTTSYGKDQDAGNVYFNWPESLPIIGNQCTILPVSVFAIELENYDAYDCDRLPFVVDITAFFRITESNTAAQRVSSFEELQTQLRSILQGAARTILASSSIEEIMAGRSQYGEHFTKEVDEQLADWGSHTVKNIELMDIRDQNGSKVIFNIMEKKKSEIEKDSRIEIANNKRAAEISETENQRDAHLAKEEAAQQVGIRAAEKEREVGLANEQSKQAIQESARETAQKEMEVQRVLETQKANIAKDVAVTKANEDKEKQKLEAEANLIKEEKKAEGIKLIASATAEQIRLKGEADAEAAKLLELASIDPQITLAKEIGDNDGYQKYLIEMRNADVNEAVGLKQAEALAAADLKVFANTSDVDSGINSLSNIFTPSGGTKMAGSLEALGQSELGQLLMAKLGMDVFGTKGVNPVNVQSEQNND